MIPKFFTCTTWIGRMLFAEAEKTGTRLWEKRIKKSALDTLS